ncbi:hypothetical protein DW049_20105, partial [Ruminococcus sp. AF41-9]
RNIFVKQDVKLTEPPDAEPHVRWCERSAAKAASYSIFIMFQFYKQLLMIVTSCFWEVRGSSLGSCSQSVQKDFS